MRRAVLLMLLVWALPSAAAELPGDGALTDAACIDCHAEAARAWKSGAHGIADEAGCGACHGERHADAGPRSRRGEACIACHGGASGAAARSYVTSKHGIIATLEGPGWDWSKRLAKANYRAPTCAYCHMHDGAHGQVLSPDLLETACADCHSTRYVDTLTVSGRRMLGIADLKISEAEDAAGADPDAEVGELLAAMRNRSLRNLRLGIAHQSPDYQWWFGQAALDGDLLRIKSALTRKARRRAVKADKD